MAYVPVISQSKQITPATNGDTWQFGNGAAGYVGTFQVDFVPQQVFVGSITVVARGFGQDVDAQAVPYVPVMYRKVYLNGLPADWSMVNDVLTSRSLIAIPTAAMDIGLLIQCTAGTAMIFRFDLIGNATP